MFDLSALCPITLGVFIDRRSMTQSTVSRVAVAVNAKIGTDLGKIFLSAPISANSLRKVSPLKYNKQQHGKIHIMLKGQLHTII